MLFESIFVTYVLVLLCIFEGETANVLVAAEHRIPMLEQDMR